MRRLLTSLLLVILLTSFHPQTVQGQTDGPAEYTIQEGDTLYAIAIRFNVSQQDLMDANQLTGESILSTGARIKIPGLDGVSGLLTTLSVPIGQNLTTLSRYYQISPLKLEKINRLTSPSEIFTGANLILPVSQQAAMSPLGNLDQGTSLLELAAATGHNPWTITRENGEPSTETFIPGVVIYRQTDPDQASQGNALFPLLKELSLDPLPMYQGSTVVIRLVATQEIMVSGTLNGIELSFHPLGDNQFVSLQGIHAMAQPGLAELSLHLVTDGGLRRDYQQMILLADAYFPRDEPLSVDPATIDKANTEPEDKLVFEHVQPVTEPRRWDGQFRLPVDQPVCIRSWFGNRRSYNGSDYVYFHTGLDYGVCANLNIYAPAPGKVVFTGPLTVRGQSIIIDHGWGVYSGFWHQSKIIAQVGQDVAAGDLIGEVGATGRVTGPHLHWEVWVNKVQVNPQEWLDRSIP